MTIRPVLNCGMYSQSWVSRYGLGYASVGQVCGWVVKKERRVDLYIFMATTKHDNILWLTILRTPYIPDCALQQLGIILIKKDCLPTLQSPGTSAAICYSNMYSCVSFISFFFRSLRAAAITGVNMCSARRSISSVKWRVTRETQSLTL